MQRWRGRLRAGQKARGGARVGWLTTASKHGDPAVGVLRAELSERGFVESRNLTIEARFSEGHADRLPALAAELAAARLDVIVTSGTPALMAVHKAVTTIPVVFVATDPTLFGVPLNFPRPEGNLTGTALMFDVVTSKWVELMHEIVPGATRLAVLSDGGPNAQAQTATITRAARSLKLEALPLLASDWTMLEPAFAQAQRGGAGALLVVSSALFAAERPAIVALAARYRLPAIYDNGSFARNGALISYGPDMGEVFRVTADYVARLLGGAKVADLPVMQPAKFELVINLKTAATLGLTIPPTLLATADEVIE